MLSSKTALSIVGAAVLALLPQRDAVGQQLTLGLIPEQNVFRQAERFLPLMKYLERTTGVELETKTLRSYDALLQGLADDELDGGFAGSYVAAQAIDHLRARPVARIEYIDGSAVYQGLVFVRRDSAIRSAPEMKGRTLVLVDRSTTAGYLFPLAYLAANGAARPQEHFREIFFAGSHDAAVQAVLDGEADVGGAKSTVFDALAAADPRVLRELEIVARSPEVPSLALVLAADVAPEVSVRLWNGLRNMERDTEGRRVLVGLAARRFVRTTSDDYAPVREMVAGAGLTGATGARP